MTPPEQNPSKNDDRPDETLADVLAEYSHDGAFCGHPTAANIPCQRLAVPMFGGRCGRHSPHAKTAKNALGQLAERMETIASELPERLERAAEMERKAREQQADGGEH